MGAQKGLKRATLKFTQKQLPAVLEARKKNKHMKIKAKQAVQTKANLQAKGAGRGDASRLVRREGCCPARPAVQACAAAGLVPCPRRCAACAWRVLTRHVPYTAFACCFAGWSEPRRGL